MEMSAYVGDVLSFYIDQQYKEMMLPLAEERRNVINMAKMFGYKSKASIPALVPVFVPQAQVSPFKTAASHSHWIPHTATDWSLTNGRSTQSSRHS